MSVLFIQNSLGKNSRKYIGINMALGSIFGLFGALLGAKCFELGFSYFQIMQLSSYARFSLFVILIMLIITFNARGLVTPKSIKHIFLKFFKL